MPITQRTRYVCDRCGWDSETAKREKYADFGDTTVTYNGSTGGYSMMGDSAGSTHKGTVWLCLECTRKFLSFLTGKGGE